MTSDKSYSGIRGGSATGTDGQLTWVTPLVYQVAMAKISCPECGSTEVIPIVYGMPGQSLFEAAERGEVELGGCVIVGDDFTHACRACGHHFRRPARTP